MTNSTAEECYIPTPFTRAVTNATAAAYILVIVMSLFGNGIVLIVIYKNHAMRTVTNLLICNSAVADLLITLLPTVWEVLVVLKYKTWPLGQFMCTFMYMSVYLSVAATVITLTIITIDRFNAVIYPYKKYFTNKKLIILVPSIWITSFLFALPTTFTQKVVFYKGYGLMCVEQWPSPFSSSESPKHYTIILFISLYALPLTLMSILYTIMAKRLAGKVGTKRVISQKSYSPYTVFRQDKLNALVDISPEKKERVARARNRNKLCSMATKKRRVIKMLISIVIVFAMCWFPVYCIQFIMFFNPYYKRCPTSMPPYAYFIAFFMQYANSAINPLLYFGFSMSYRKGYVNAFPCCFRKGKKKSYNIQKSGKNHACVPFKPTMKRIAKDNA